MLVTHIGLTPINTYNCFLNIALYEITNTAREHCRHVRPVASQITIFSFFPSLGNAITPEVIMVVLTQQSRNPSWTEHLAKQNLADSVSYAFQNSAPC